MPLIQHYLSSTEHSLQQYSQTRISTGAGQGPALLHAATSRSESNSQGPLTRKCGAHLAIFSTQTRLGVTHTLQLLYNHVNQGQCTRQVQNHGERLKS